jgi:uncharacterized protein (DUF2267 family)
MPAEALHFIAQLPSVLKDALAEHLDGPYRSITRASMKAELGAVLAVDAAKAEEILEAVALAVASTVSPGQIATLRDQLPEEMKDLFPRWAPRELTV